MEDASRRPNFKRTEARQFLVAAQPSLATPVKYSPTDTVAMMANGERPVAPAASANRASPAAAADGSVAGADPAVASRAPPAAAGRPRSASADTRGRCLRTKTASAAARAATVVPASSGGPGMASGILPRLLTCVGLPRPMPTHAVFVSRRRLQQDVLRFKHSLAMSTWPRLAGLLPRQMMSPTR